MRNVPPIIDEYNASKQPQQNIVKFDWTKNFLGCLVAGIGCMVLLYVFMIAMFVLSTILK